MNRRNFLRNICFASMPLLAGNYLFSQTKKNKKKESNEDENKLKFLEIIKKAQENSWNTLPMGLLMGRIGMQFLETPYVGGTLDINKEEKCVVNLLELDCVTFFENVLGISLILKKGLDTFDDLINQVTETRYRNRILKDYTSRLHYTAEWIIDNEKKGIVRDITNSIGGNKLDINVWYMSENYEKYPALKNNPNFVPVIKSVEQVVNSRRYWYLPKDKVRLYEQLIQTGDIIAIATNMPGLDYSHTGIAYRDDDDNLRLLHASSSKKKVILDVPIVDYLSNNSKSIGISVIRVAEINYKKN